MGKSRAFAYPKRYAVLSLRLDTAFMFPADAQPEREVPHIWRLPPSSLSSLSGGRAPPEVPPEDRFDPQKAPRRKARGLFAKKYGNIVKTHKASVCISAADKLKNPDFGSILHIL